MYLTQNKIFFNEFELQTLDKIPVGNWMVCQNPETGEFYLNKQPDFKVPEKLYGDCEAVAAKFLNTWKHKSGNMGILLDGMKGTGKSLLARYLSIKSNLPTLIVATPYNGAGFMSFMAKINQEVIIFMDEFEKIYVKNKDDNANPQDGLLSILDGAFPSKFMFILTTNESSKVSQYLLNRPGRIHYVKTYRGLDESVIIDLIDDRLTNKSQADEIIMLSRYMGNCSMDMIISLILECNIYQDSSPKELFKDMNLRPDDISYKYVIKHAGETIDNGSVDMNPMSREDVNLEYYGFKLNGVEDEEDDDYDEEPIVEGTVPGGTIVSLSKGWQRLILPLSECKVVWEEGKILISKDEWLVVYTKQAPFILMF